MTVLPALHAETMPVAIVQRARKHVEQTAATIGIGARAFGGDTVLQHVADHFAIVRRPCVGTGIKQTFTRGFQSDRCAFAAFGQGLPDQAKTHAGRSRPFLQFGVDVGQAPLGILQQPLHGGGDFRLQMVFQYFAFALGQQFAALPDFVGDARLDQVGALRPVLVNDGDDQAIVAGVGLRLVTERGQCAL